MNKEIIVKKVKKFWMPAVLVVALATSAYFYFQLRKLNTNPQAEAKKEAALVIAAVGKIMILPPNEIPTIATVSDPNALKDQAFFNNAQKGDKVLIYSQSKKAILYSPSMNKIIDVAPLNIGAQGSATISNPPTTPTPAATPTPAKVTTPTKKK
jgi:hypothetical protein